MTYFRDSLRGLGVVAADTDLVTQAVIAVTQSLPPIGVFTQWGAATGSNTWRAVAPESSYILYALGDAQLRAVQQSGVGAPGFVAVLSDRPIGESRAADAFAGTPYEFFSEEGVYRQDDGAPTPRIWFLAWFNLRGERDAAGGNRSPEMAAGAAGGRLVFPITIGLQASDRAHPSQPFATALALQIAGKAADGPPSLAPPPSVTPAAPAAPPAPAAPAPAVATALPGGGPSAIPAGHKLAALLWVGAGVAAVGAVYYWTRGRRRVHA